MGAQPCPPGRQVLCIVLVFLSGGQARLAAPWAGSGLALPRPAGASAKRALLMLRVRTTSVCGGKMGVAGPGLGASLHAPPKATVPDIMLTSQAGQRVTGRGTYERVGTSETQRRNIIQA